MYFVETFTDLYDFHKNYLRRDTLYLEFETYTSAVNCLMVLTGRKQGTYCPEDYFEAATLLRNKPFGEQIGVPIETDLVLTYAILAKN